jgi:hypothetical protein
MARKKSSPEALIPWWQVRIELLDVTPRVWRRLIIPENLTLPRLNYVLQSAMGWQHSHLHEFVLGGQRYSTHDPDFADELKQKDERRVILFDALPSESRCFDYIYDFGDNWHHVITVEDPYAGHSGEGLRIRCLAGENACPPEDVGGAPGYEDFLAALADPAHEEHENFCSWIGGSFDSTHFDIDAVNENLADIKF